MDALVTVGVGAGLIYAVIAWVNRRAHAAKASEFREAVNSLVQSCLRGERSAEISVFDPADFSYRPVANERLLGVQDGVARLAFKSTGRSVSNGFSFSVPIVKGVRYRIGTRSRSTEKTWQAVGTGRLLLTDKAMVFESDEANERITWGQIADIALSLNGIEISKRSGPPRIFRIQLLDPKFAATAEIMRRHIEIGPLIRANGQPQPPQIPTAPLKSGHQPVQPQLLRIGAWAGLGLLAATTGAVLVLFLPDRDHIAPIQNRQVTESDHGSDWKTSIVTSSVSVQPNDDASLFISKFGSPDFDISSAEERPRPPIVTRQLVYLREGVRAVYVPDAAVGAAPPYRAWKLVAFQDHQTNSALAANEAVRRLTGRRKHLQQ